MSLVLYCTGVRGRRPDQPVTVKLGAFSVIADYAGVQPEFPGLDQINIVVPRALAGAGEVVVSLEVAGLRSNDALVTFQ